MAFSGPEVSKNLGAISHTYVEDLMSKKAIVTGVAGFIGSHLAEKLLEEGYSVTGIDNFHSYYSEKIKRNNLAQVRVRAEHTEEDFEFEFIEGSILESPDLKMLPDDPELVFHLAAVAGTRSSMSNPSEYIKVNVQGTSKLIQSFDSIEKFVFVSSSSIYGELSLDELPVTEDSDLSPETPYALSKINAEQLVELYSDLYDFDYTILRPFTVYGPRQRPDQVVTKFLHKIISGEPVTIYGDGSQTRDFTYVGDAVKGILKAAKKGEEVYNLSGGRRISVNQLVDIMEEKSGKSVKRKYMEKHPADVMHTHADISKAKDEINYSPKVNLEEGIEKSVEWYKNSVYASKSVKNISTFY